MKIAINIRQAAPGCFRADCATMPGCVAVGQTQEQACENMRSEIASYVASMDGILPQQLDFVVAFSIRHGEDPEPEMPVDMLRRLNIDRKPLLMQSDGLASLQAAN